MKPDACIDLLEALMKVGSKPIMFTEIRSLNGNDTPAYLINSGSDDVCCRYEFMKDMFCISDGGVMRIYTNVSDIKFEADSEREWVKAIITREFDDIAGLYTEVIYGSKEEYAVRTV